MACNTLPYKIAALREAHRIARQTHVAKQPHDPVLPPPRTGWRPLSLEYANPVAPGQAQNERCKQGGTRPRRHTQKGTVPADVRLRLYVTNTLGNPDEENEYIPQILKPLAESRRQANRVKRAEPRG
jgi:hypothetical protein